MATNLQTDPEPGLAPLLTGIVNDFQDLLKQQMALFKHEVTADMRKTREAATSLGFGLGVLMVGGILLCLTVVYLLYWAIDGLPLWGAYAIVTAALVALGGCLTYWGWAKFRSFNPLPDETAAALKENLEWTTKQK